MQVRALSRLLTYDDRTLLKNGDCYQECYSVDLEDFIAQTLSQIMRGVRTAQHSTEGNARTEMMAVINPAEQVGDPRHVDGRPIDTVDFDVAVTTTVSQDGETMGGIKVLGIGIGGSSKEEQSHTSVSRIKFSVPAFLPTQEYPPRQ